MNSDTRINSKMIVVIMTLTALAIVQGSAGAAYITFSEDQDGNSLAAGDIITSDYDDWFTLTVDSNGGYDIGMIFDSAHPTGGDNDLGTPSWAGRGNAQDQSLGNILIISEDGETGDPDDQYNGGSLLFDFSSNSYGVDGFGFHLVDAENSELYQVKLYSGSEDTGFLALQGVDLEFGNNSINEISPYLASTHGWARYDKVEVKFGGSGGIDNITFNAAPVPEPATLILFGSGLIGLAHVGRARKGIKRT